jgi:hypothetical protein
MDPYADVLDHIGKTPRELGAVHAHFESLARAPGKTTSIATLLFQAAFEPAGGPARVRFFDPSDGQAERLLAEFPGPELKGGAVIRARYPLRLEPTTNEVWVRIESVVPPKAERVRPAWKLHDTFEIPKLSEMRPATLSGPGIDVGHSLLHSALSGSLVLAVHLGERAESEAKTVVHKARALPDMLKAAVEERELQPLSFPELETLWTPGSPLPEAVPNPVWRAADAAARPAQASETRLCLQCGFEGEREALEKARFCPSCDAIWL